MENILLLQSIDLELINQLKDLLLFPKTVGELKESIKIIDEDKVRQQKVMNYGSFVDPSLYHYYDNVEINRLLEILKYL